MAGGISLGTAAVDLVARTTGFAADMARAGRDFERVGARMQQVGASMTRAVTLPLAAIGGLAVKAAIDFESSFAGIRKTMDLTEREFGRLAQANRDLAKEIPVTVNELNRIGELGGQLGIRGVDNVLAFERTIAELAVTTDLTADSAALAFAQIANVIQLPQDQIPRLGAAVVALGNNFATVESQIVEFTARIAGAGAIARVGAGELAGIATAFASLGVNAEAGGTAVQKVLLGMVQAVATGSRELRVFADTAGQSVAEFGDAFRTDAAGAFASFVEGLGRQGESAIQTLDALGLSDQRLARAFLGAAQAGDLLRTAIETGAAGFREANALSEEAAKRFETAASQLRVFWNRARDVAITLGSALVPALLDALRAMAPLVGAMQGAVQAFAALPSPVRTTALLLAALAAATGPVILGLGALSAAIGAVSTSLVGLAGIQVARAVAGWAVAFGSLALQVRSAAGALALLEIAIGTAGWLVLGAGAVGVALLAMAKHAAAARAETERLAQVARDAASDIATMDEAAAASTLQAYAVALEAAGRKALEASARLEEFRAAQREASGLDRDGFAPAIAQAEEALKRAQAEVTNLATGFQAARDRLAELAQATDELDDTGGGLKPLTEEQLKAIEASEELVEQLRTQVTEQERLLQATAQGADAVARTTAEIERERDVRDALRVALAEDATEVERLVNAYHDLHAATRSQETVADLSQQVDDQRRLVDATREGAAAAEDMRRTLQFEATLRQALVGATAEQAGAIRGLVVEYFNLLEAARNADRAEETRKRTLDRTSELRDLRGLADLYRTFRGTQDELTRAVERYNAEIRIRQQIEAELARDPNQDVAALRAQITMAEALRVQIGELADAGEDAAIRWGNAFVAALGSIQQGVTAVVQSLLASLSQIGGSVGTAAAIGAGVLGTITSAIGASNRDAEEKAQEEAIRRSIQALDDFAASLKETTQLARNLETASDLALEAFVAAISGPNTEVFTANIERVVEEMAPAIAEMVRGGATINEIFDELGERFVTNRDALREWIPAITEWVDAIRAAQAAQEEAQAAFVQDLELRQLEAQGLDAEARARRNELEVIEAQRRGFDEATIAALQYTQALEEIARLMARAEDFASTFRGAVEQRARRTGDVDVLRALGEQEIQEIVAGFQELVDAGILTQEEVTFLAAILRENLNADLAEFAQRALDAAEAAREAAAAAAEAARQERFRAQIDTQNLRVQLLQLQGRSREAIALQNQIDLLNAINEGRDAEYISLLQQIGAERLRQAALNDSREALDKTTQSITGLTRALNAPAGLPLAALRIQAILSDSAGPAATFGLAASNASSQAPSGTSPVAVQQPAAVNPPVAPSQTVAPVAVASTTVAPTFNVADVEPLPVTPEFIVIEPAPLPVTPVFVLVSSGPIPVVPDFRTIEPPPLPVTPDWDVRPAPPIRITPEWDVRPSPPPRMAASFEAPERMMGGGRADRGGAAVRDAGATQQRPTVIQNITQNFGGITIQAAPGGDTERELLAKFRRAVAREVRSGGASPVQTPL
jgi:TP901 family phage tail tape measure protein